MGEQASILKDWKTRYTLSAAQRQYSEVNMPFRYQKQPFMLTNDEGVQIRMGSNSSRDGWYTFVYNDCDTEFAFHASNREVDELGHTKMRGRWEIAHLGGTSIGEVTDRGFLLDERRRYLAIISDALGHRLIKAHPKSDCSEFY